MAVQAGVGAAVTSAAGPYEEWDDELPLGADDLAETRASTTVAPGATYTRILRGVRSATDRFVVDVAFRAARPDAEAVAERVRAAGYEASVERIGQRAPDDPQRGPLGYLVRSGEFATEPEALALRDRLMASGFAGLRVVFTGEDGGATDGPWVVHVLQANPKHFRGSVAAKVATDVVPEREPLSRIAARSGALAAINGGYFVIGANDGTPGDLAGISVLNGALLSEAMNGARA